MPRPPPLLKSKIIEAQLHTKSNMAAARYLGVNYELYRSYAKLYGLFDSHANVTGVGIAKGFAMRPSTVKLKDIFAGKHINYSLNRLKRRMINRGLLLEQCGVCGFNEQRITDGRRPLILTFKDGLRTNMSQANIYLLCYNCMFLTTGLPQLAHKRQLEHMAADPHQEYPALWLEHDKQDLIDIPDPEDDVPAGTLTDADIAKIQHDIQHELDIQKEKE